MSEPSSHKPTPFAQFCFFKSLSYSLFEDDWINMVESWQAMFSQNMTPFFANAPRLLPVFHRYMTYAEQDPEFLSMLTNVLMSTPLLIKVQHILQSTELFLAYVVALKLDVPSASHTQVMQSLQTFLSSLPEDKRLEIQKVFAEEEASDSMGFTPNTLDTALQLLHADTQLYIDILSTLQLNQTENMPWDEVSCIGHPPSPSAEDMEADNDDDDDHIIEMVEGVDYYSDEDEDQELGSFLESEEYNKYFAAFLQDVQDIQTGRDELVDDFGKIAVTADNRQAVESC
ncbi:hypothetical protein BCR41DRAFT_356716 [Lobosporangium transversale]|uniref:Uncharacterized protein n=1 Tax=Lobosporangium transversale TaxID=64571 RepID=A0A1Y2GI40_9FUNG|nr:hypothetical protein BCR41DRAFT_357387 [Lobosporangium transversale]XP_021879758.1 hypothetical protein BCR41DRAFT_356716 [Lobosporangium transversale]ORZ11031.1 hypothetical protein BCR41DRAFT_357387 [Lobosporangium transversale]ORZ11661.1 hypothetical protein BCR41DRAFT_356716 [Lobosporangium transversale]|eukprot:XP_021879548.1 hypothetical protein BCR41DRAFT_357387 [Lobosporangium transversale]